MPAALDVNREAVRVLVVAVGVREAARQMQIPAATVQAWSARGKWLAATRDQPATMSPPASQVPATSAINPADALAQTLAADSDRTKIGFSTTARKFAEHVAAKKPSLDKDRAQAVRHMAGVASTVHGWEGKDGGDRRVMINIGILAE